MRHNQIAKLLLQINAIKLKPKNPFTWSSGKKSPIYCDNRLTLSYPKIRKIIQEKLITLAKKEFKEANLIAGVATAGIPHGVLMANKMSLPFIYVRSSEKKHGRENKIEGEIGKNRKILIVEDLISTGKSSLQVAEALKNVGCEIVGIISIFNYNFIETEQRLINQKIKYSSLCNFEELIKAAEQENYISKKEIEIITNWHSDF